MTVFYAPSPSPSPSSSGNGDLTETVIWDRKRDGGFPGMFSLPLFSSPYLPPSFMPGGFWG